MRPEQVPAEAVALLPGDRRQYVQQQVRALIQRIQAFLFKTDGDSKLPQPPDRFDAFFDVARKARDRLYQDQVDLSRLAILQQPLEPLPLFQAPARSAPVAVDARQFHLGIVQYPPLIVRLLQRIGRTLLLRERAHAAVDRHPSLRGPAARAVAPPCSPLHAFTSPNASLLRASAPLGLKKAQSVADWAQDVDKVNRLAERWESPQAKEAVLASKGAYMDVSDRRMQVG